MWYGNPVISVDTYRADIRHLDDVLQYIGPSLKQYEGCDIIDLCPGLGVLSSKVHDFLKPRTHLLLEPCYDVYGAFLRPLTDSPGSRFKLLSENFKWDKDPIKAFNQAFEHIRVQNGVEEQNNREDRLLLIANLTGDTRRGTQENNRNFTADVVYSMIRAIRQEPAAHARAPPRLLLWLPERNKYSYVPRMILQRNSNTIEIEALYDVEEVASPGQIRASGSRSADIDRLSAERVTQRMARSGLTPPSGRNLLLPLPDLETEDSQQLWSPRNSAKLANLEADLAAGKFTKHMPAEEAPKHKTTGKPRKALTPEYQELKRLRAYAGEIAKRDDRAADLLEAYKKKGDLEAALVRNDLSEDERQKKDAELQVARKHVEYQSREFGSKATHYAINAIDDQQAFDQEPPLLAWDRRTFEPLAMSADEYIPDYQPPALLDFRPKPTSNLASDQETNTTWMLVARTVLYLPEKSVAQALNQLQPGADALLASCPSITDPKRGGKLEVADMRARMLTVPMLDEIVKAYMNWPFRQSTHDFLPKSGSRPQDLPGSRTATKYR